MESKKPIITSVNYNLSAHGANSGHFFDLPPNTRILLPSLPEAMFSTVSAECLFAKLSLVESDPTC